MTTILIEQLDADGNAYRTFTHYVQDESELDYALYRINLAYNMDHTRVTTIRR